MAFTLPTENLTPEVWATMDDENRLEYYNTHIVLSRKKEELPWPVLDPMPTGFTMFDPGQRPTSAKIYEKHVAESPEYSLALEAYQEHVLDYYECAGFPIYKMDDNKITAKLDSLLKYVKSTDHEPIIRDNLVYQSMHGLSLAWLYFPHSWSVQCGAMKHPQEIFNDRNLFRKALIKRMKFGVYVSDSGIRKALRSFSGSQSVSNFRPSAAAAIYDRFLPEAGGVTWDMSSGFGGRLLGAMACPKVRKYIGTDPSTPSIKGVRDMWDNLKDKLYQLDPSRELTPITVELLQQGSEDPLPVPDDSVDLCFTSPPYFDTEKYTDEPTQSYIKYGRDSEGNAYTKEQSQKAWLYGFMKDTLANCHRVLKSSGRLVVNIADVATYPDLNDQFVKMAEQNGWKHLDEEKMYLLLSKMMGTRGDGDQTRETRRQEIEAATDEKTLVAIARRMKVLKSALTGLSLDAIKDKLTATLNDTTTHKVRDAYKKEPIFVFEKA